MAVAIEMAIPADSSDASSRVFQIVVERRLQLARSSSRGG